MMILGSMFTSGAGAAAAVPSPSANRRASLAAAQMRASGALVPIADPRAGASLTVSSPLQISGQEKVPPTLAPEIGQHTVEVLRAAGIAAAEIERLLKAGVIVQA